MSPPADPRVRWPAGLEPARAAVFAHNTLAIAAPPARVWAWLISPLRWSELYDNCHRMRVIGGGAELALGTRFTWRTFGVPVDTVVDRFEPERCLAWSGQGLGARGHHVWLLAPTSTGCELVTEEVQVGAAVWLLSPWLRRALPTAHQRWLEGFARAAALGAPADVAAAELVTPAPGRG